MMSVRALTPSGTGVSGLLLASLFAVVLPSAGHAQTAKVRDLTISEGEMPVRLVGYGLVVGLDGTGDRAFGGREGSMTVRSVANLLRNLGIEVPERVIRTRNAAAVLVTSEASAYTRRGGRFDINVASLGDATSLRGGQLWQTPLLASVGGTPMAVAQGNILFTGPARASRGEHVETSAVLTDGAVAVSDFGGQGAAAPPGRLLLRRPDLATAQSITLAINATLGGDVAAVEDPGSIALQLPADDPITALVALGDIDVTPTGTPRVVIDAQSGAVAAGGDISVGMAVVSHEWLTLTIAPPDVPAPAGPLGPGAGGVAQAVLPPGAVRAEPGIRVQSLAEALHAVGATAEVIGAVFRSLRSVGALQAEVIIR
jgi:flagellar P-ring protein precursor FlgI